MDELNAEEVARGVVANLERAWNQEDGQAFADAFAADADFVNVRGEYHGGRGAIAAGHQAIFGSIYKGSRVMYKVIQARSLTADVIVAHVRADLNVPSGQLAGNIKTIPSLVLVRGKGEWHIASFHNTPVAP